MCVLICMHGACLMLSQVPICFGVFMNSYFDLKFNIVGIVYASAGVIVTALYQVVSDDTVVS